jgi:DNA polymerase III sliding clamp (beta) subunit (PCNA family)
MMTDLLALSELEDENLVPEILPVDIRLSVSTQAHVLISLFSSAQAIVPSKEILPYTTYVSFEALDKHIRVSSTDGERSVAVLSDVAVVRMPGSALLEGKRVLDILKLVEQETVRIDVIGTTATIRSGRALWTLSTPPVHATLPSPASVDDIQFHSVDRDDMLNALELALPAVARSSARQALMQAEISKGFIISCDGARAHKVRVDGLEPSLNTTLPLRFIETMIRELKATEQKTIRLGSNDSAVVLHFGKTILMTQRMSFEFPAVNHLVLGPALLNDEHLLVDRASLISTLRRVRVNADPEYLAVVLSVRNSKDAWILTVSARDRAGNASQEQIPVSYNGPEKSKSIVVNHKYLLDFLSCIQEDEVDFRLGTSTKTKQAPLYYESERFVGSLQPMMPNVVK